MNMELEIFSDLIAEISCMGPQLLETAGCLITIIEYFL